MPKRAVPIHPAAGLSDYVETLQDSILTEPDRIAGVLGRAYAGAILEILFHDYFVQGESSDQLLRDGALANFSTRIRVAYALGCLPKAVYNDLQMVREIGNHFAHELTANSLDESPVRDWCENSWLAKNSGDLHGPRGLPGRARQLFNTTMVAIALELEHTKKNLKQQREPDTRSQVYRGF